MIRTGAVSIIGDNELDAQMMAWAESIPDAPSPALEPGTLTLDVSSLPGICIDGFPRGGELQLIGVGENSQEFVVETHPRADTPSPDFLAITPGTSLERLELRSRSSGSISYLRLQLAVVARSIAVFGDVTVDTLLIDGGVAGVNLAIGSTLEVTNSALYLTRPWDGQLVATGSLRFDGGILTRSRTTIRGVRFLLTAALNPEIQLGQVSIEERAATLILEGANVRLTSISPLTTFELRSGALVHLDGEGISSLTFEGSGQIDISGEASNLAFNPAADDHLQLQLHRDARALEVRGSLEGWCFLP